MIGSSIKRPETKLITSENMLKKICIIIWNYPFLTSTKMIRKKVWQIIRHFVKNNNNSSNISPLAQPARGQSSYCFSDEEKVECLNNCFTSITDIDDSNFQLLPFQFKIQNLLSDISCRSNEVEPLIKLLNPNKATGPDGISNRMLKAVEKEISIPLSILFNRSFREGIFALLWKESNVLPLFKKGDKSLPSNYRPISLLSNKAKLQERIVFKNMATGDY